MEQRFIRSIPAISENEQLLLRGKHAAIIGCGGLGGYIAELLARAGLGCITLCDGDHFEESNLNRQCLALPSTLGQNKAAAAAQRIKAIDNSIDIRCFEDNFTADNAREILDGVHIVLDALDNIPARLLLADICAEQGLVLIHGAVSAWVAQVCTVSPGSGVLHRLYGNSQRESDKSVLSHVPAYCAALQCSLALKSLLGRTSDMDGKLLVADTQTMDFVSIEL